MQSSKATKPCTRRYKAKLQRDIIKTLVYADIFNYPLSIREVWSYLIGEAKIESKIVQKTLSLIAADCKLIDADGEFYFLKGREEIVETRKEREGWSKEKREIAQKTADKLKIIPTIKMIGITGALAMENCPQDDDIDLLIITSDNCLWLTRFLIIVLCSFLKINRRKRSEKMVKDKICLNLFLEEGRLKIKPENLFLAHEIVQVKPIFDRDNIYERFLWENQWVSNFLPNTIDSSKFKVKSAKLKFKVQSIFSPVFKILDKVAYILQLEYMKPKMTIEKVSLHQAFFHPGNLGLKIEKEYNRKITMLGLDNKPDGI